MGETAPLRTKLINRLLESPEDWRFGMFTARRATTSTKFGGLTPKAAAKRMLGEP
jgi:hypothetical protein